MEIYGTAFFAIAILHTFLCGRFGAWSHQFPATSLRRDLLHLFSEVEVVFGLWAAIFFGLVAALEGPSHAIARLDALNFTEPMFVFVIMVIAATRPILDLARDIIVLSSRLVRPIFRISEAQSDLVCLLILGPLAGSLMTEPAAMTVTALLLRSMFRQPPKKLAYALLAVLFVNISIGGALTPMAAPPILMVARLWQWDFSFVFAHFGWKSILAVTINSIGLVLFFAKDLRSGSIPLAHIAKDQKKEQSQQHGAMPHWVIGVHILFLVLVVLSGHHQHVFFGLFLLYLGISVVTRRFQDQLRLRESLLVAFFLAGIMCFGPSQKWWLEPLLAGLSDWTLYLGAIGLTSMTDNAALTYLGSQVPNLSHASKYALVAGALVGGGLTLIANAPNAAGYSILNVHFPQRRVEPLWLFVAALAPTIVAAFCFWL